MQVINVIRQILNTPEKEYIYISFQNILNNHYDAVFEIIYCFDNLTLKDLKKFKIFEIKEMSQNLSEITFSTKYKKAVYTFYEMMNSNENFLVLLDTMPHNKKSAIFILKLKLKYKKSHSTNEISKGMFRLLNALVATNMDVFVIICDNLLKSALKLSPIHTGGVPREEVTETEETETDPIGIKRYLTKIDESIVKTEGFLLLEQKFSPEVIAKYFSEVNKAVLNSEGFRLIMSLITPENIAAYVNLAGITISSDTILAISTTRLMSDFINFLMMQTTTMTYESETQTTEKNHKKQKELNIKKENLENLLKKINEIYCLLMKKMPVEFKKSYDKVINLYGFHSLNLNIQCLEGGTDTSHKHTSTHKPEPTSRHTPEHTSTHTPEHTPTHTPEHTPEHTPTHTPTHTPEHTSTHTPEHTSTHTSTHTPTHTPEHKENTSPGTQSESLEYSNYHEEKPVDNPIQKSTVPKEPEDTHPETRSQTETNFKGITNILDNLPEEDPLSDILYYIITVPNDVKKILQMIELANGNEREIFKINQEYKMIQQKVDKLEKLVVIELEK